MASQDPDSIALFDGWQTLIGGMDANRRPRLINPNQFSSGINVTVRGGWPMTRPAWTYKPLIFLNDENETWFKTEVFQGGIMYQYTGFDQPLGQKNEAFVCSVGGRIWTIDPCSFVVQEITPGGRAGRNSRCHTIAYFVQAEQFLVIQDGDSKPIIWDGGTAFRAGPNQVPVGTIMAYGQGRIWLIQGPQLLAGDLVGSYPNAVIGFTEISFLATNGIIYPGSQVGNMTGLAFIPQQDTSTGIGSLLVLGEQGIAAVYADKERSTWVSGISRVTLINIGGVGHRSVTGINGDVWFESKDGWRSYRHARGEQNQWYQLPMSEEVNPYITTEADNLKPYNSSIFFDNRLIATTQPIWQNSRWSSRGLIVLDFNVLSSFGDTITSPSWEGLWTGVNVMQLIRGKNTAWAFGIDESGSTSLYQLATSAVTPDDDTSLTGTRRIEAEIVLGAYSFNDKFQQGSYRHNPVGPQAQKTLWGGETWIRDLAGAAEIDVYYRRDGEECFQFWKEFNVCADVNLCDRTCAFPAPLQQYRNRLRFGNPAYPSTDGCSTLPVNATNTGRLYVGYEFQPKITWKGRLTLSLMRLQAMVDKKEPDLSGCDPDEAECSIMTNCCYDPFSFTPAFPPYTLPPFPPADPGCTDPNAINYNPLANPGDGSCIYPKGGCTDSGAFNYDPTATFNNGSCIPRVYGCTNPDSVNFNPRANTDDGSCEPCVFGCTNSGAANFDPAATCDDGSCFSPSGQPIGCNCAVVSISIPPPPFVPAGADPNHELIAYQDSKNVTPVGGYKQIITQSKGNTYQTGFPNNTFFSIMCNSLPAPTLQGIIYQDEIEGKWYFTDPYLTEPAITDVLVVFMYTTGMSVWREIALPAYPGGPNTYTFSPVRVQFQPFDPKFGVNCAT